MQTIDATVCPKVYEHQLPFQMLLKSERLCHIEPGVIGWKLLCPQFFRVRNLDILLCLSKMLAHQIEIALYKYIFTILTKILSISLKVGTQVSRVLHYFVI